VRRRGGAGGGGGGVFLWVIYEASSRYTIQRETVRWIGKDLKGSSSDVTEVLSWQLSGGAEENHKNPDVPTEFRTAHRLNASQHHCR
jgi:hypothetical protein